MMKKILILTAATLFTLPMVSVSGSYANPVNDSPQAYRLWRELAPDAQGES